MPTYIHIHVQLILLRGHYHALGLPGSFLRGLFSWQEWFILWN